MGGSGAGHDGSISRPIFMGSRTGHAGNMVASYRFAAAPSKPPFRGQESVQHNNTRPDVAADVAADVVSRSITLSSGRPSHGSRPRPTRCNGSRWPMAIAPSSRHRSLTVRERHVAREDGAALVPGQEPRWQTPSRPCEPPRPAWVPVELPGLGHGTDEYTPRGVRGRARPYGTEPHRRGLRTQ